MALIKLNIYERTTKGKNENRRTRVAGYIPAVLYGGAHEARSVQLDTHQFTRILQKTGGRSVIYDLQFEGTDDHPLALMRELQQHPVSDEILHVDLFEIPRNVPVTVPVSLVFTGEPACVKIEGAEVLQLLDTVELSCLPRELPESIEIDVGNLVINDKLFVSDLKAPVGEIMNDPETQILVVKPPTLFVEEEVAATGEIAEGEAAAAPADEGAED
jgi:large subunit ribosomal protein L25